MKCLPDVAQERRADRASPASRRCSRCRAGLRATSSKSRKRDSCRRMPSTFASICSTREQRRAPATCRSDRRSSRCRRRRSRSASGRSAAAARAPSSAAAIRRAGSTPSDRSRCTPVTRSFASTSRQPVGGVVAPGRATANSSIQVRHRRNVLLYQRMAITRRAAPQGRSSPPGVGALTGTGAYGFVYDRHDLGVTRHDAPGHRTAAGARRAAHRPAHRHPSQPLGLARGRRRRRDDARSPSAPDLIVLGGDYVTWGDRALRRPVGRSAHAAHGAEWRLRASSATTTTTTTCRRRSPRSGVQVLKDARTRLVDQRRDGRSRRHPVLDPAGADIAAGDARRRRHGRSCSRTIRGGTPSS